MTDHTSYDYWQRTLAGERVGMSEDKPEPGFYRYRHSSSDLWMPLSIFYRDGELFIVAAGNRLDHEAGLYAWLLGARHAIDEQRFRDWMATGKDPKETVTKKKFSTLNESKTYSVTDRKSALAYFAALESIPSDFDGAIISATRRLEKSRVNVPGTHIHKEERIS